MRTIKFPITGDTEKGASHGNHKDSRLFTSGARSWPSSFWPALTQPICGSLVGWSAATNLSDAQPWGIWVGLATLCGVGLSAGGFTIAAAVYLLGMERYRPIVACGRTDRLSRIPLGVRRICL